MGSVRLHSTRGTLFLDFRHQGRRCREYTALPDSPANRQRLQRALAKIEQQIADGTFDYEAMFPPAKPTTSPSVDRPQTSAASRPHTGTIDIPATPAFRVFIQQWIHDQAVEWRAMQSTPCEVRAAPVSGRVSGAGRWPRARRTA